MEEISWKIIDKYFKENPYNLIAHHLDSYNNFVSTGISKILNRPFAFIALGGATDSSFLEGHSYTYEGSTWGKNLQIIIERIDIFSGIVKDPEVC